MRFRFVAFCTVFVLQAVEKLDGHVQNILPPEPQEKSLFRMFMFVRTVWRFPNPPLRGYRLTHLPPWGPANTGPESAGPENA